MKTFTLLSLAAALALSASAAVFQFNVSLDGAQEVGGGDVDGTGTAVLFIDDTLPSITWNISINNVNTPLTGAHIHNAVAGVNGSVVVNFSGALSGGPLSDPDLTSVLASPTSFYVNLHNADFPGGAIRGQLGPAVPEPDEYAMIFGAGVLLLGSRPVRKRLWGN
jgi:hypothetical protein